VQGVSVDEGSISPADVFSHGRRAVHLLRTPLYANAFYLWIDAALRIERRTHRMSTDERSSPFARATYSNSCGSRLYVR
jgi:hypothetical protein